MNNVKLLLDQLQSDLAGMIEEIENLKKTIQFFEALNGPSIPVMRVSDTLDNFDRYYINENYKSNLEKIHALLEEIDAGTEGT